ncbi:MAG: hypothetical protein HYY61_05200 [Deltaproteobacteria bacterium]|nr:hypothetical protein [Deltaproteobacteria bacterium]
MRGNLLFILIFSMLGQLLLWGGCAQQDSRAITAGPSIDIRTSYPFLFLGGLDPAERFQKINDHFSYGCEKNLNLINYVQKTHVKGDQIEVVPLLQRALRDILQEGRLPTPYFIENAEEKVMRKIKLPVLVNYIYFKSSAVPRKIISDFNDIGDFCSTIDSLSQVIQFNIDFEKSKNPPHLLGIWALLHKSVFRYFVASLDPHSLIMESPEHWYVDNGLKDELQRSKRENILELSPSQDNPYYPEMRPEEAKVLWKTEWIQESSVLRVEFRIFDEFTTDKFQDEYKKYRGEKNISALVIDLRRNPGGSATEIAKLADLFLKEGELLFMREKRDSDWQMGRHKNGQPFYARSGNELPGIENIPVVILVSRYSSSSSETFAAAMQDHEGAIVIGERTCGKGTGQRIPLLRQLPLGIDSGAKLELTTLYTYSPKGAPIQIYGITPDIEVEDQDYVSRLIGQDMHDYHHHREAFRWPHALPPPDPLQTGFEPHPNKRMRQWKEKLKDYFESRNHLFTLSSLAEAF